MSPSSNDMIKRAIRIRRILYQPLTIHHANYCSLSISNFKVRVDFMPTMEKKPQARHTIDPLEARVSHIILFTALDC